MPDTPEQPARREIDRQRFSNWPSQQQAATGKPFSPDQRAFLQPQRGARPQPRARRIAPPPWGLVPQQSQPCKGDTERRCHRPAFRMGEANASRERSFSSSLQKTIILPAFSSSSSLPLFFCLLSSVLQRSDLPSSS
jgi:hypothetical protein